MERGLLGNGGGVAVCAGTVGEVQLSAGGGGPGQSEGTQLWRNGLAEVGLGTAVGSRGSIRVTYRSVCCWGRGGRQDRAPHLWEHLGGI